MRYLPRTLATPEENLAIDDWLLQAGPESEADTLRIWESTTPLVVLGRASRVEEEVDTAACQHHGAAVRRRVSGGATIVCGPGCLMYAVTIGMAERPDLQAIDACHPAVLSPIVETLSRLNPTVQQAGTSDLAFQPNPDGPILKFSGNSLRVTRYRLLYHGTLLYDFDLTMISKLLRTPPRQPEYRGGRPHSTFVGNLPLAREELVQALRDAWPIEREIDQLSNSEQSAIAKISTERYTQDAWNLAR